MDGLLNTQNVNFVKIVNIDKRTFYRRIELQNETAKIDSKVLDEC